MKRTARDCVLLGKVWAELGAARITEAYIRDRGMVTEGYYNGAGHITINPVHQAVDTIIHECLHRAFPQWGEGYVRRTTTFLRKRMGDEELQAMYDEFNKRKRTRKRPLTLEP